ncbi:hypothetical protein WDZ16_04015 [Pseudokineococcus marinus]|uniref:Membrane protein YfhO n=1 Tax=Pseudokineococcus marinus TaxID=351215 RepID=A0A849BZ89_9ACTN|nr:hypothetical protein [Pseudokineococcus marinus]NNH22808.1 hypothetical protein [Pseudokineococcus marinus]
MASTSRAPADPARPAPAPPRGRTDLLSPALVVAGQSAFLVVLSALAPRFFWFDDAIRQFGPAMWWLGRRQEAGQPPLMDPELGMAGNFTADMQYGVLDPLHWVLQAAAARFDDLVVWSWVYGGVTTTALALGVLALLRQHGVRRSLAVPGALGASTSGFLLWFGSSWWPLLLSLAVLPWLWVGLRSRGAVGVVVTGLATWALLTSGNPYVLPFALVLIAALLVERGREAGSVRALVRDRDVLGRAAACVGGLLAGLPTLLTMVQTSAVTARQGADPLVGNAGYAVTNFLDVVLAGPTLLGQTNAWVGSIGLVPAMGAMVVAVPLLVLVDWRRAVGAPGVVPAALLWVSAVVATQLPTTVLLFRYPLRYLVVVQVAVTVLAVLAVSAAPRLTRGRLLGAAAVVALQVVVSLFRAPGLWEAHVLGGAVVALGLLAAVALLRGAPAARAAAVVLVVAALLAPLTGVLAMRALEARADRIAGQPEDDMLFRGLYRGDGLGRTVESYRERSVAVDEATTVVTFGVDEAEMWDAGVMSGNGNLLADLRPGFGSHAVWQEALDQHWCRGFLGFTCGDPAALLETATGTDLAWVDLLSSDEVLLDERAPQAVLDHFAQGWTPQGQEGRWLRYGREDGLPGRVTAADGVELEQEGWVTDVARRGQPMDAYTVTTGASPGEVVLRTTWWPGLRAAVDGEPVPVDALDGAVLRVEVPAGVDAGRLEVSYAPVGAVLLVPLTAAGLLLVAAGAVTAGLRRRGRDGAAA